LNVAGDATIGGNLTLNGSGAIAPQARRLRVPLYAGTALPGMQPWTAKSVTELTAQVSELHGTIFSLQLPHKAIVTELEIDLIPAPVLPITAPPFGEPIGETISLIQLQLVQVSHDTDAVATLTEPTTQSTIAQVKTGPLNLLIDNQSFSYHIILTSTPLTPTGGTAPVSLVTATKVLINYSLDSLF
jgi:hypothetical protein